VTGIPKGKNNQRVFLPGSLFAMGYYAGIASGSVSVSVGEGCCRASVVGVPVMVEEERDWQVHKVSLARNKLWAV